MRKGDLALTPQVPYKNTKVSIEALTNLEEGMEAYATDTNEKGVYTGASWDWGGGGIPDAPSDDEYYSRRNGAWAALTSLVDGWISSAITALGLGDLAFLDAWSHAHDGVDGSGTVSYDDLTDKPTITNPPATTAVNDFQVGDGAGAWIKKTLAETRAIIGFDPLHFSGFAMSNNGSDANNDIDLAAGKCRNSDDTENIVLASSLTKRLDASWTVGTNQGGLDTGAKANSTWYNLFAIKRPDTGVVDAIFSTSAAPSLPANYTKHRLIGSVKTDGSGNIRAFINIGNRFMWTTLLGYDLNGGTATSATAFTITAVPSGRSVRVGGTAQVTSASGLSRLYLQHGNYSGTMYGAYGSAAGDIGISMVDHYTDTSPQLYYYVAGAGAAGYFGAFYWEELRTT